MIQTTNKEFEVYEAGIYTARCKGVKVVTKEGNRFGPEPYQRLQWSWEIKVPGRKDIAQYSTWTSLSLNSKSHLPGLLAALGVPIVKDAGGAEGFDENAVEGKVCQLVIETKPGDDGKPRNNTTVYVRKNGQTPAPKPVAASVPEPEPEVPADEFDDDLIASEAF